MRSLAIGWVTGLFLWSAHAGAAPLGITHEDEAMLAIRGSIERVRGRFQQQSETLKADSNRLFEEVEALLVPLFDMPYIGQLVLGRHWASASKAQRARFIETFKNHLIRNYSQTLLQYEDTTELRWESAGSVEGSSAVIMEVVRSNEQGFRVEFAVRQVGDEWKIFDVSAQGISMATNFRGQFNAVIKREGLDALIARLEEHTAKAQAASASASGAP